MTGLLATVLRPGLTTVQDGGRRGFTDVGVPRSGALHRERYLIAAGLVTGALDPRTPALEVLGGLLELELRASVVFAVVGPADVALDGSVSATGSTHVGQVGAVLSIRWGGPGPVYVGLAGWQPPLVLGSAATDTFSRLGGPIVAAGAELAGTTPEHAAAQVGAFHRPLVQDRGPVRVVPASGPVQDLTTTTWQVSHTSRSGIRLAAGDRRGSGTVPSSPTVPGAIQLTPSGEPIILGPDGALTGGYPVVAVVADADRDRVSLLAPGDEVGFRVIDVSEAARLSRERKAWLRRSLAHARLLA